ncbi:PREDICTED: G patch domain-containing protein 4 [Rhagoletis zephyria]|uniref:G patch domain-containing protein 4 n=1 Tax=Rhagoletis zephyria TaxID=28612 RepID=UPI0008117783|nr:PREDICTED: G patch domain-containing protein 4 [Rhagoletis zephyria]XP_017492082.1 PREDICTED: G patch domain-containing protein 4 [Rhagoletis zephyria]
MDFARRILNKYGWKEGEGLGKHSDGIVKPLKASMKFDHAGLGSDQAASDFNNHWWERVFNEAATNVEVKSDKNGITMDLKNKDDSVEISTKGYSTKKLKKAKQTRTRNDSRYDNFLQSATLTKSGDEIENPNKIAITDISVTQYKTLTDEELFRACGGRTAHKGARHGLKLSGKLSRIEQQEQELLAKMQEKLRNTAEQLAKKVDGKVKRKKGKMDQDLDDSISQRADNTDDENPKHRNENKFEVHRNTPEDTSKRNKTYKNRACQKISTSADTNVISEIDSVKKIKRKVDTLFDQTDANVMPEGVSVKKKSKRNKDTIIYQTRVNGISEVDSNKETRKKRIGNEEDCDTNAKKSKKKITKPKEIYHL